jgi:hypothetical protein
MDEDSEERRRSRRYRRYYLNSYCLPDSEKTPSRLLVNRARPPPSLCSCSLLRLWLAFSFYFSQHHLKCIRTHSCISPERLVEYDRRKHREGETRCQYRNR